MRSNTFFSLAIAGLLLLLNSCGDGGAEVAHILAAQADSLKNATTIDLGEHHVPLTLQMPSGVPAPSINWKDEVGKLEVRAGDRFAIIIVEEPGSMDRLKADLDRDLVKKNTIVTTSPEEMIYKAEFPDDTTLVFFHFYRIVNSDGRTFVVQDAKEGIPFTLPEIEEMSKAVTPRPSI